MGFTSIFIILKVKLTDIIIRFGINVSNYDLFAEIINGNIKCVGNNGIISIKDNIIFSAKLLSIMFYCQSPFDLEVLLIVDLMISLRKPVASEASVQTTVVRTTDFPVRSTSSWTSLPVKLLTLSFIIVLNPV